MGGYGSGPYGAAGSKIAKTATGQCPFLDIRQLRREWDMNPGWSRPWSWTSNGKSSGSIMIRSISENEIVLEYTSTINGHKVPVEDSIRLTDTNCNYGGVRRWFSCPQCKKRIAVLYLKQHHFRCRHCHDLNYYSSQESGNFNDMSRRRVNKVLRKLKSDERCSFDILYHTPARPRYMHRKTYGRLLRQYDRKRNEYAASVSAKGF